MSDTGNDGSPILVVGFIFIVGILIGAALMMFLVRDDIQELGQAICEVEYDMDFLAYSTKTGLECHARDASVEKQYDGIKVKFEAGERWT